MVLGLTGSTETMGTKPASKKTAEKVEVRRKNEGINIHKSRPGPHSLQVESQKKIDTSDWKTWYWGEGCGDFEIKYPPEWKISGIRSDELGSIGWISYGLLEKNDGIVINISYSTTSAVAWGMCEKREKEFNNSPKNKEALSISILRGTRKITKRTSGTLISMDLCAIRDEDYTGDKMEDKMKAGIFNISVSIFDLFNKGYEKQVKQVLFTFKVKRKRENK